LEKDKKYPSAVKLAPIYFCVLLLLTIAMGYDGLSGAYYHILRFSVSLVAMYTVWKDYKSNNRIGALVFLGIAIAFNPIYLFHYEFSTWKLL